MNARRDYHTSLDLWHSRLLSVPVLASQHIQAYLAGKVWRQKHSRLIPR